MAAKAKAPTEADVAAALEKKAAVAQALGDEYSAQLDERMGHLHNQFVAFVAASELPLPQVLLVLEILVAETVAQATAKYMGR